jgi:hypothetical protein
VISFITVIASVIVAMLGSGFVGNYLLQRLRSQQDAALARVKTDLDGEMRRLQTTLDRTVLIHRVQFETEFAAMKVIWEKVMNTRGIMAGIRPTMGRAPRDETPAQARERFATRLRDFRAALGELKDSMFNSEPFITEPLFRELFDHLLVAATAEELNVSVHDPHEPNWFETGEKNLGDLMRSSDRVSRLIRARIQALAVVPELS